MTPETVHNIHVHTHSLSLRHTHSIDTWTLTGTLRDMDQFETQAQHWTRTHSDHMSGVTSDTVGSS